MALPKNSRSLISGFLHSLHKTPARPALEIGDDILTYEQLWNYAGKITDCLTKTLAPEEGAVALLASRSVAAYGGILGILGSGRGYCPLNPKFPVDRTLVMLKASGCRTLIVGEECAATLDSLLPLIDKDLTIIIPDPDWVPSNSQKHRVIIASDLKKSADPVEPNPSPDATAYLLFTSGSTGVPKGVAVSQSNAVAYMEYAKKRFAFNENDRCSQNFDLTFDLSVHDLFTCWDAGATLVPYAEQTLTPATLVD